MDKSYAAEKVKFLNHRILVISQRLAKPEGANVDALKNARLHFKEMLSDYKKFAG